MTPVLCLILSLTIPVDASVAHVAQPGPGPLVLQYDIRPPYVTTMPDGTVGGILASPVVAALRKAGVPFVWRNVSPTGQLANVRANVEPICGLGWYKTPERQAFAKYSKAIYQDGPMIGVANARFQVPENPRVDDVLGRPEVRILTKSSIVYGPYLDAHFAGMKAQHIASYEPYAQLVKVVKIGRVDLTFVPQEEAEYYVDSMGYHREDFHFIHFADMPQGEKRYIICSKMVDDAVMHRFDAALK